MKNILKTLLIFLCFILGLCTNTIDLNSSVSTETYIQNDYQKVVLISQNLNSGELIASRSNNNSDSNVGRDFVLDINFIPNYKFANNNLHIPAGNIHNLSNYLKTEISTRAP